MNRKQSFEIIESKHWVNHETKQTASLYGSVPYVSDRDKFNWSIEVLGYTVRNIKNGTVGIGKIPWKTEAEAEAWLNQQ